MNRTQADQAGRPDGDAASRVGRSNMLVSVVIPVKNRASFIGSTLATLRAQTHRAWEAVVVDDNSEDDTRHVVAELAARDVRIRLLHGSTGRPGASSCRNIGAAAARGQCVIFLDSDDLLTPTALAGRVAMLEADPSLEVALTTAAMFREQPGDLDLLWNRITDEDPLDRLLLGDVPWQTGCATWRRAHGGPLVRIGPWDERLVCSQDQDFFTRAMLADVRYQCDTRIELFVRAVQAGHDSIAGQWWSRAHLLGQRVRIEALAGMLEAAGRLDAERRMMVAGNYFWVARALVHRHGDWTEGTAFWRRCRAAGLIDTRTYRQGRIVLALQRTPLARAAFRWLQRRWPAAMFAFTRGQTRKTVANDDERSAIAEAAASYVQMNNVAAMRTAQGRGLIAASVSAA